MWCLYPNKNAALESVENAFGQEPMANYEVTPEKVYFNAVTIILIVDLQIILTVVSVL